LTTRKIEVSNRKDILLLLLYVPGPSKELCEPITGRTRIMKLMYLFEKELYKQYDFHKMIPEGKMPAFEPYKYGPFSVDIFKDLSFFMNINFIQQSTHGDEEAAMADMEEFERYLEEFIIQDEEVTAEIASYEQVEFKLTDQGACFAEELLKSLSKEQQAALTKFKVKYMTGNLNSLLVYVYRTYPESATKSEIKEKILDE